MRKHLAAITALCLLLVGTATATGDTVAGPVPNTPTGGVVSSALSGHDAVRAAGRSADNFRSLHQQRVANARKPLSAQQIHTFWGPEPQLGSSDGMVVTQSITPGLTLSNSNDTVYAPTMKPTGHSCIEITTAYGLGDAGQLWAWDWCDSVAPAKVVYLDSSFVSTYTTTVNGHPAYTVQEVQASTSANTWTASLYNYQTKAWDMLFTQSGSDQSGLDEGWDIFEIYATHDSSTGNAYYCSDASGDTFESSAIQLRSNGVWTPASASDAPLSPTTNPQPRDYDCATLKFSLLTANNHWRVTV